MKHTHLPVLPEAGARPGVHCEISSKALELWNPCVRSAASAEADEEQTISILDVIGEDYWTGEGVTAKRISAALRSIGATTPVTVNINSPGGNTFEGIAIYNLLREHKAHVTVRVLGVAASAASVIAMAGDTIEIGRSSFFMIHNAWVMAIGNRNELREVADWLEPFDAAMADVYATRTGIELGQIQTLMDRETWINGTEAVEDGFADALLSADQIAADGDARSAMAAARRLDVALAKAGLPRSDRRKLMQEIKSGMPSAAGRRTQDAATSQADSAESDASLDFAVARLRLAVATL